MNWYEIALGVVLVVVSLLIVVFTLAQEQKGQGLSGAIMGESSATMAAGRERGVDAKRHEKSFQNFCFHFVSSF